MQTRSLNFRLSLVFLFFFLLVIVLGLFCVQRLSEFNRSSADIRDFWLPNTRFIGDLDNFTSDFRAAEGRHLLSSTPPEADTSAKEIGDLDRSITQAQSGYESLRHWPAGTDFYAQFKVSWIEYRKIVDQVLQLSATGRTPEAITLYRTRSQSAYNAASDALERLAHLNVASASTASDRVDSAYREARRLIGLAMLIAAALVMAALLYVKRAISMPLIYLADCMRRLADNRTEIEIHGTDRIDEIGEMSRAVVVFRNNAIKLIISQRALSQQTSMLEERLAQEQRLTQLQQDFVSMASHEFRTPLTIIDGQAQRLIKIIDRAPARDIVERAGQIRKAVLRMTTLIDNLLNSSRLIDRGAQFYFHPTETDLRAVLQEVCHLYREIAPQSLIRENLGAAPLQVLGDSKLLFQMFGNLISNSIKYSPDGSLITVTANTESKHIVVAVQDRGIGIPEKDQAQVFGRYSRGSNVSGIVGTGVGLFLVKMVTDLHGGSVAVASKEGEGSRFTVRLPMALPARSENLSPLSHADLTLNPPRD